jgi:hypothetical protein
MPGRFLPILALACAAWAANVKLYLKEGGYQLVREYQVQADRVHFYSVERSEWEDIPLDLVDLKRTEAESASRQTEEKNDAKLITEERQAERQLQEEVSHVPGDIGVYWVEGSEGKTLKQAEATVRTEKGKFILRRLAPMPTPVTRTATMEVEGAHATAVFTNQSQEFYVRPSDTEPFGIARLVPKSSVRVAEEISYMGNEADEEPQIVPTLQLEMTEGLYKIWPKEPLPPGEYAVVQYTLGKVDMQIWDFAVVKK